jgi:hypothetical protein
MGYRSEIAIAMAPATYESAPDEVKAAFTEMFGTWSEWLEDYRVVFAHDNIKWYRDFPEVQTIEKWLRELPDKDYALYRLGEDPEDTQTMGEYWEWDINHINHISKLEW